MNTLPPPPFHLARGRSGVFKPAAIIPIYKSINAGDPSKLRNRFRKGAVLFLARLGLVEFEIDPLLFQSARFFLLSHSDVSCRARDCFDFPEGTENGSKEIFVMPRAPAQVGILILAQDYLSASKNLIELGSMELN